MCTRLHAIGFACEMDRATADSIAELSRTASKTVTCAAGEYRIWRSSAGAEIWLHYPRPSAAPGSKRQLEPVDDLRGLSVYHRGSSSLTLRIDGVTCLKTNPLDGVCLATIEARKGRGRPAPFTFELLGAAAEQIPRPTRAKVALTGLAHRVWAFPTEQDYLAETPPRRLLGRGALTVVKPEEVPDVKLIYRTKPGTLWLVTGTVKRSIRLVNPITGAPYVWMSLDTDRGDIDLVANPAVIEGDVSSGHTIQTLAAMVGRVIEKVAA